MARNIEQLVALIAEVRDDNVAICRELRKYADEMGVPLEFALGTRRYGVDDRGLWRDGCGTVVLVSPDEYLDSLRNYLLEQLRTVSLANRDLKTLIRRFLQRQATWAELKQVVE